MRGNLKDKSVKNKTFMRFVVSGSEESSKAFYHHQYYGSFSNSDSKTLMITENVFLETSFKKGNRSFHISTLGQSDFNFSANECVGSIWHFPRPVVIATNAHVTHTNVLRHATANVLLNATWNVLNKATDTGVWPSLSPACRQWFKTHVSNQKVASVRGTFIKKLPIPTCIPINDVLLTG